MQFVEKIRAAVRKHYGALAQRQRGSCGCAQASSCCGNDPADTSSSDLSEACGYSSGEFEEVPGAADMSLGCGNPVELAAIRNGETVLDLGSGGGFDCFLAGQRVGSAGHVIGVDMTPEMLCKARETAESRGYQNVEFRLGEIENLPVADESIDVIMSNCVINLSPDKLRVFREAFRVLRPGGRLAISDIIATIPLSEEIQKDLALYTGCIAGAAFIDDLKDMLSDAGFQEIRIRPKNGKQEFLEAQEPGRNVLDFVVPATIEAIKSQGSRHRLIFRWSR